MHGFGQPNAAGIDLLDCRAGLLPEVQRHEACHVAAKAVHNARPEAQGFDLVVPEPRHSVVEVDHVRPVTIAVAGPAVGAVIEIFRVGLVQHRVGRGMVIYHVDQHFHTARVDLVDEGLEVLHSSVGGVYITVVAVCIGAAETALLALRADGMDGHEPDDVRAEGADAVQIGDHGAEGSLRRVRADVDGVDDLSL